MFFGIFLVRIPRGAHPKTWDLYKKNINEIEGYFKCFDGSGIIDLKYVNDNYADCNDGSDEPGTPATNNGTFYCINKGNVPKEILKWSVYDGVCDCCDGSDEEGNLRVKCPSNCRDVVSEVSNYIAQFEEIYTKGIKLAQKIQSNSETMIANAKKYIANYEPYSQKLNASYLEAKSEFDQKYGRKHNKEKHQRNAFESLIHKLYKITFFNHKSKNSFWMIIDEHKINNKKGDLALITQKLQESRNIANTKQNIKNFLSIGKDEIRIDEYKLSILGEFRSRYNLLGVFDRYEDEKLFYEKGDSCFVINGQRHAEITTHCWDSTILTNINEATTCFFTADLASPAFCNDNAIKDLRQLDLEDLEKIKKDYVNYQGNTTVVHK
ncbi:hypothetical protein TVAG_291740 [Trichomonas vaginalis G3]|uniref:Glucosidase 2 subunit beta n=1 Tax=Trichomonas vaginalis (strain ATCC PRA-98 / G3) TaxID=412133 RepID=A2DQV5_TRIV3|nr:N-glycan processing [Trichomonas vaginalis G3]EAY17222.1 hypothetical protein TVAG_291740 [Trichomonas vaginalis G3]KAI5486246.1 N-glycan processing [Trichomonas vaginalis G3]|eukprot:XP_001329445.1 hypothetical protein [Trichomonas vaginalis G3]